MFLSIAPIAILLLAKPTPALFWGGVPFAVVGEAIRLWSAGYLTKLKSVITAGPFALCRNPLYVGSFLISVGYFVMCNRPDVWIAGVALFWLFHGGAIAHEEKLLAEKFGKDYLDYCQSVPRLLPRLRRLDGNGEFSFAQLVLNREYRSASATVVLLVWFGLIAYYPHLAPLGLLR